MIANPKRIQNTPRANRIRRILGLAALAASVALARGADSETARLGLGNGESLTYSVRWGFLPSVGRIRISAEEIGTGRDAVLRITTTTSTWGLARGLFPFDGRGESVYEAKTGLLLSTSEWSTYRNKVVKNSILFNYGKMEAVYTDDIHPEKSRTIPMPSGNPSDLILALISTRTWKLAPGQARDALVIFEDQFYPLTVRSDETDIVMSPLGLFSTNVLVPRMEKSPPKGMFKRGSTVKVWIETNDARRLPVRFEVGFRFGTGTATLIEYQAPK